jgi:hypothetical protein
VQFNLGQASFFINTMKPEAGIGARVDFDKTSKEVNLDEQNLEISRFALDCAKEGAGFVKGLNLNL